ncbi:MAG: hypothetical protein ABIO85_08900 [Sphingomicrobium sp.]
MNSAGRGRVCRAHLIALAVAAIPAVPLAAQNAPTNNSTTDSIGPEQLRNFSLGGPAAQPQPQPVQPDLIAPTTNRRPAPRPASPPAAATPVPRPAPVETAPTPTASAPTPAPQPRPTARAPAAASSVTVALPPADPLSRAPTRAGEGDVPRLSSQPMGANAPLQSAGDGGDDPVLLPWIVALLMLGGAAIFYALRTRGRPLAEPALAGPALTLPRELPPRSFPPAPPAPAPPAPASPLVGGITVKRPNAFAPPPQPTPAAEPPRPIGIVSTRLRPQLEIEFDPTRATIDEAQASVQFDVVVTNSGSGPARQVLVEACMINAGPEQDAELRRFFDAPVGQGDRIDSIPPLGRIALKSAVSLPLEQVRAYEVGGRKLFVPLVAFNALYQWGSGEGQSSAAFILGRASQASDGEGDADAKMAPLRLDLGPRIFRGLEGRRHPLGLRR